MLFDEFNGRTKAGLPLTYDVQVRYRGPTGRQEWNDTYPLDLGMYLGSRLPPRGLPELVSEVESIRKEIEKWKGDSNQGLLVHTLSKRQQDRIATRRTNVLIFRQMGAKALARSVWDRTLMRFGLR